MEGLLENVRQLSRELRQHMLVIDQFIPPEYQVSKLDTCLTAFFQVSRYQKARTNLDFTEARDDGWH